MTQQEFAGFFIRAKVLSTGQTVTTQNWEGVMCQVLDGNMALLDYPLLQEKIAGKQEEWRKAQPLEYVTKEMAKQAWKHPVSTWDACIEALKPIVSKLLEVSPIITMNQIREAAETDPLLSKHPNSIGQRSRDLVKQGYLNHVTKDGRIVPGYYRKGRNYTSDKKER